MTDRRDFAAFLRRLRALAVVLVAIVVLGTLGLVATEGVGVWRGFIWTLDILATVGSTPAPDTVGGQIVKVGLIVLGVGTLFYGLVTVTEVFVSGHLAELLQERRAQKLIDATSDHYIICGFGRVGRQVARDLRAAGARYVVVDHNPDMREHATGIGVRFIEGEPSDDEVLRAAGVMRARGVIACVDSDADNIFITLTVRGLRPDVAIVARASEEAVEAKLLRAGATRVISPYKTSGSEMARARPNPQNPRGPRPHPADPRGARGRAGVPDGGDRGRAGLGGGGAADRGRARRCHHRRGARRLRPVPSQAAGGARPARRRRRHGDGHRGDDGAPRGAVRAGRDEGSAHVTPVAELRAAVEAAAGGLANGGAPRSRPTLERPKQAGHGDY